MPLSAYRYEVLIVFDSHGKIIYRYCFFYNSISDKGIHTTQRYRGLKQHK